MIRIRKNTLRVVAGTALTVLAVWVHPATAQEPKRSAESADYTRTTDRPYADVFDAIKAAAPKHGFRVSNVHDIHASLKKDGIDIPPYATVEVCNSKVAAEVLKAEPRLGALMPCRIAVYRHGDKTVVSMVLPSRLMTLFPDQPAVREAAAEVDRAMKAIVDEATGAPRK